MGGLIFNCTFGKKQFESISATLHSNLDPFSWNPLNIKGTFYYKKSSLKINANNECQHLQIGIKIAKISNFNLNDPQLNYYSRCVQDSIYFTINITGQKFGTRNQIKFSGRNC